MDRETGEVTQRADRGALCCTHCNRIGSMSWNIRGATCGVQPLPFEAVRLHAHSVDANGYASAGVLGVRRCRKFWTCPSCANARRVTDAATITAAVQGFTGWKFRREKSGTLKRAAANDNHRFGRRVYLLTLTVPHNRNDDGEELRRAVTTAYRKVQSGKAFARFKMRHGIAATLRRLEVTHGANGFHPHIHALWFTYGALDAEQQSALAAWVTARFSVALQCLGFSGPEDWCVDIVEAKDPGDYLAKMGVLEAAGDVDVKHARCTTCRDVKPSEYRRETGRVCSDCGNPVSRNMWQVLEDWGQHSAPIDKALLRKFHKDIFGARMLTWSRWRGGVNLRSEFPPTPADEAAIEELMPDACHAAPLEPIADVTLPRERVREILGDPAKLARALHAFETRADLTEALGELAPPKPIAVSFVSWDPEPVKDGKRVNERILDGLPLPELLELVDARGLSVTTERLTEALA